MSEGYVKFQVHLTQGPPPAAAQLERINAVRTELHDLGLIGILPNGIGYGNVSVRADNSDAFVVSGTATGAARILTPESYCRVDRFDTASNEVWCTGRLRASSESMSHGAVYRAHDRVCCVIHVHSREIFESMRCGDYPGTPEAAEFGTPELATEIERLVRSIDAPNAVFVTAGHQDGVIAYGPDPVAVRDALLELQRTACG